MPSDVQVFVRFRERCVFAGEEVDCVITFKNVADISEAPLSPGPGRTPAQSGRGGPSSYGHSSNRSISAATLARGRHQANGSLNKLSLPKDSPRPPFKHQRSVSIVSINSAPSTAAVPSLGHGDTRKSPQVPYGHRRSSTVQYVGDTGKRVSPGGRQPSSDRRVPFHNGRRSPLSTSQSSPADTKPPTPDFKFPPEPQTSGQFTASTSNTPNLSLRERSTHYDVSQTSYAESHRDSTDVYTYSNNSGETLMSEQVSMVSERPQALNHPSRSLHRSGSLANRKAQAITLLMGYAQVGATFTLDASLVDQTPFEEVKKKGFLGGQAGGGVVGAKKKARPTSGLFGAFNFSSIGESLESIMGGDNLSSVREMKAVTSSRAIPLLSTPQSLLFVDLHLDPGDEKSYSFAYKLPKGLPSSYKGKAIKIAYNLTIGVQGSPGRKEMQAVRQVNIPIRVFSGVDTDGEIFGHDLMQPYVVLRDTATTRLLNPLAEDADNFKSSKKSAGTSSKDFLKHVDILLDRSHRRQSSAGTVDVAFGAAESEGSPTTRAINRAIMLSNQIGGSTESSPNRFEIARNGLRIATVVLDRPLHRLGETVTTIIDLSGGEMMCTSLRATLESVERVAGSLAVRSAAAISRITRKVYASQSENILFARRAVFCPTIPVTSTPTFVTSGVNLDWFIKLEFGSVRDDVADQGPPGLLEEISKDERGTVNVAVESLDCETFEVAIPITVYGDVVMDGKEGSQVTGISI